MRVTGGRSCEKTVDDSRAGEVCDGSRRSAADEESSRRGRSAIFASDFFEASLFCLVSPPIDHSSHLSARVGMSVSHPAAFLLENPTKLYRDCLRLADFLARKQGFPRQALRAQVTAPWRTNQHETDPETIMRHREAAVRGLSNYMMYEASKGVLDGKPNFVPEDEKEGSGDGKEGGSSAR
jgi:hypothetical protein